MKKFFPILAVLAALPQSAGAQSECTAIAEDSARLACYDIENGRSVVETTEDAQTKWRKSTDTSALTDEKSVFLSLSSDDVIPARFGSESGPATLMLRCKENTTSAFLFFNGQFMSDIQGYGRVEYRVDENKMQTANMSASTSNEALGLWDGRRSIPFIKQILGHSRLVIRATPFNESAITVTFDIRGIDDVITELRETCKW